MLALGVELVIFDFHLWRSTLGFVSVLWMWVEHRCWGDGHDTDPGPSAW